MTDTRPSAAWHDRMVRRPQIWLASGGLPENDVLYPCQPHVRNYSILLGLPPNGLSFAKSSGPDGTSAIAAFRYSPDMTSRQSGPVRHSATEKMLKERRAHYFMDQQVSLHGTIVSIALGVAGLAAASLFKVQSSDRPYHLLFWLLWVTSILATPASQ